MKTLVAGVGNVFLGDDAFGVVVVERLRSMSLPMEVDVVDFGIRGLDLAYAMDEYEAVIIVDVIERGGEPGCLYLLDPVISTNECELEMHSMTPDRVLQRLDRDQGPKILRIVGCEPASFGEDGIGRQGLSGAVFSALDPAIAMIEELVSELTRESTHA